MSRTIQYQQNVQVSPRGPRLGQELDASERETAIIRDKKGKNRNEGMRGRELLPVLICLSSLGKLEKGWQKEELLCRLGLWPVQCRFPVTQRGLMQLHRDAKSSLLK